MAGLVRESGAFVLIKTTCFLGPTMAARRSQWGESRGGMVPSARRSWCQSHAPHFWRSAFLMRAQGLKRYPSRMTVRGGASAKPSPSVLRPAPDGAADGLRQRGAMRRIDIMNINEIARAAHANSKAHGFWDGIEPGDVRVIPEKIALIHSEVSEALEVYREHGDAPIAEPVFTPAGKPIGFDSELADIIIRVGDLAEHLGVDLYAAIRLKMQYNTTRPHKHGKRL